jgi:hypothetical protein
MLILPKTTILGEKPNGNLTPIQTGVGTIFQPNN